MAEVFNVGGSIPRVKEFGGGARHYMRDVFSRISLDALSGGRGSNCVYDPLTGTITPRWAYTPVDTVKDEWQFTGAAAAEFDVVEYPRHEQNTDVLYYHEEPPVTWAAILKKRKKTGEGMWFFFHTLGTYVELAFGKVWNLILNEQAPVMLKHNGQTVWFGENFEFRGRDQYFVIYPVGPYLVIKWSPDYLGGIMVPIFHFQEPFSLDGNPTALSNGQVAIQANGTTWFSVRDLTWENSFGWELRDHIPLWNSSSQAASGAAVGYLNDQVSGTLTILNQDDTTWLTSGSAFRWQIDITNNSDPLERWRTAFIYAVQVNIPRTLGEFAGSTTDLNSVAAVENVRWTTGLRASDHTLELTVFDTASLATYLDEGLALDWVSGGTTLFTGTITRITRSDLGNGIEKLVIEASAAQLLYHGTAVNILDQAGNSVETALTEAFNAAGIPSADIDVTSTGLDFVIPANDEAAIAPKAGETPGHFIDYLIQNYAADHFVLPTTDWNFSVLDTDDTVTATVTFGAGEGDANRVFTDTVESLDVGDYHNGVICVGQDIFGQLLLAVAINWDEVNNAQPYRLRLQIIIDSGLKTQAQVNWVCLQAYNLLSAKRTVLRWRGTWVAGVIPSQRCVVGSLGTYRLTRREVTASGTSTAAWEVWYEGVKVA